MFQAQPDIQVDGMLYSIMAGVLLAVAVADVHNLIAALFTGLIGGIGGYLGRLLIKFIVDKIKNKNQKK
jgi:hypothetical protein